MNATYCTARMSCLRPESLFHETAASYILVLRTQEEIERHTCTSKVISFYSCTDEFIAIEFSCTTADDIHCFLLGKNHCSMRCKGN